MQKSKYATHIGRFVNNDKHSTSAEANASDNVAETSVAEWQETANPGQDGEEEAQSEVPSVCI